MHMNMVSYQILILFAFAFHTRFLAWLMRFRVSFVHTGPHEYTLEIAVLYAHSLSLSLSSVCSLCMYAMCMCWYVMCGVRSFETEAGEGNQKLIKEKPNPQCKMDSELETTAVSVAQLGAALCMSWDGFVCCCIPCDHVV